MERNEANQESKDSDWTTLEWTDSELTDSDGSESGLVQLPKAY